MTFRKTFLLSSWSNLYFPSESILLLTILRSIEKLKRPQSFIINKFAPYWKNIFIFILIIYIILGAGYDQASLGISSGNISGEYSRQIALAMNFIYILAVLPSLLIILLENKRIDLFGFRLEILLLLLFITVELSVLFSINPTLSTFSVAKFLRGLLIYFIFSRMLLSHKNLIFLTVVFMLSVLGESILGSIQFVNGHILGFPILEGAYLTPNLNRISVLIDNNTIFRTVGTFPQPNQLAHYINFVIPLSFFAMFQKNKIIKIIAIITILLGSYTILTTLSRWGLAVEITSFLISLFFATKFIKPSLKKFLETKIVYFVFTVIVLALFLNPYLINRFSLISLDDKSLVGRLDLISQGFYIAEHNLMGIGIGGFTSFFANYDVTTTNLSDRFLSPVHNAYLLMTTETGIISTIIFFLILIEIFILFTNSYSKVKKENKSLILGFFVSFLTFLIVGLWEPLVLYNRLGIIFWIQLGLLTNFLIRRKQYD